MRFNRNCHLCGVDSSSLVLEINTKPKGETYYEISEDRYYREIRKCNNCGVFFNSRENLIPDGFYEGKYNESIIEGSLRNRFEKIIKFGFKKSDNKNRVLRIVIHLYKNNFKVKGMDVLDVGGGTGVFLHEMRKFGFNCYSVDPDPASFKHSKEVVNVKKAYCGTLENLKIEKKFDLISFNKVLEHIENPISVLNDASKLLNQHGLIYIELPSGEDAKIEEIKNRSEFYIDHHTIWNKESFNYLVNESGFKSCNIKKIIDPSKKHTLFAFLKFKQP